MAVAGFCVVGQGTRQRAFDPPKRSSLRHWYRAATKLIPDAPQFTPEIEASADVTAETITFKGDSWTLFIARRRTLKA